MWGTKFDCVRILTFLLFALTFTDVTDGQKNMSKIRNSTEKTEKQIKKHIVAPVYVIISCFCED